ncbi:4'-phosphopantetheinyl transferase family protein [Ewingella americana]|uniref:4'-phosphopantetheinyl transferase family protein n=1 Tax=Ewingella americana TaxID=41202 RepID=UPI0012AD6883|nr:4'-phosphopantetheinyl transferase superfamily protein [Ewingella americana]MRT03331.1 4'-phosphopantetheinyl transferase superfamily protein [Ewingella americana]
MSCCLIATGSVSSRFAPDLLPQSVWQQAAAMGERRREPFLGGRALLAGLMRDHFGCAQLPDIQPGGNGKPAFCDSSLPHFSLSHSHQHLLVAVCSYGEVGCDIETLRPRASMPELAREVFSDLENQWLPEQGERLTEAFWQLWTLREACLKQQGGSVWQMASVTIDPLRHQFSAPLAAGQLMSWMTAEAVVALALPTTVKQVDAFTADQSGQLAPSSPSWLPFSRAD